MMPELTANQQGGDTLYTMKSPYASFRMDQPEYGGFTFETAAGLKAESVFAGFGDFPESLTLHGRRKPHVVADGNELTLETENHIPFGAEPKVRREFRFDGGALAVSTTFVLRHSFEMRSVFAGGLRFSGPVASVTIQPVPETAGPVPEAGQGLDPAALPDGAELYASDCPPLRLILSAADGSALEFELGEDIWRWVNARRIGGTCRYAITKRKDALEFSWQLYVFTPPAAPESEETEPPSPPPGRDWRIRFHLVHHDAETSAGTAPAAVKCREIFDMAAYPWPESALVSGGGKNVCFVSSPALNTLKKWVRKQFADAHEGDVFGIANAAPCVCRNSAHVDRPKADALPHWSGPALDDFARWANRQLAKFGARLVILS